MIIYFDAACEHVNLVKNILKVNCSKIKIISYWYTLFFFSSFNLSLNFWVTFELQNKIAA